MDARLFQIHGKRLRPLLRDDCPTLARAIVEVIEGRGKAYREDRGDLRVIYLASAVASIVVRGDDWELLVPYLKNEVSGVPLNLFAPKTFWSGPTTTGELINGDTQLYNRILAILVGLFPTTFPTSNL